MKNLSIVSTFLLTFVFDISAQTTEKFDITTYSAPNGWQKRSTNDAVFFSTEDKAKGTFGAITLFRAFDAKGDSKTNFNAAWDALAAQSFKLTSAPRMSAPASENGWTVESGLAPFEKDGKKGVLMLITATGGGKMVNQLVLTNTDAYQNQISSFVESLSLPPVSANQNAEQNKNRTPPPNNSATNNTSGITKSTTNFSDGWTATAQNDYVLVTKDGLRIFVCYPVKVASFAGYQEEVDYFWQNYVQSMFDVSSKVIHPTKPYVSLGYGEGDAVDKATGRPIYVVITVLINNAVYTPIIAAAPDKQTFYAQFPKTENLAAMVSSNRFAVAPDDLAGNWDSNVGAFMALVYTDTGNYAGMNATAMSDKFAFDGSGGYTSEHKGATGRAGSQNFYSGKFKGRFQVSNWEITLTSRENGRTIVCSAYFEAVKNGKILHLIDKKYSGTGFNLVKAK